MSKEKIDVLAVFDSLIEYHDTSDSLKGRNCIAARAAVAELIEAATEAFNAPDVMFTIASESESLAERLELALARIGGTA
jgi:hypothetical protein